MTTAGQAIITGSFAAARADGIVGLLLSTGFYRGTGVLSVEAGGVTIMPEVPVDSDWQWRRDLIIHAPGTAGSVQYNARAQRSSFATEMRWRRGGSLSIFNIGEEAEVDILTAEEEHGAGAVVAEVTIMADGQIKLDMAAFTSTTAVQSQGWDLVLERDGVDLTTVVEGVATTGGNNSQTPPFRDWIDTPPVLGSTTYRLKNLRSSLTYQPGTYLMARPL